MSTNILYGETERRVYPLSMIYDPSVDDPTSLESEAKIIPAVSSLIVDDTSGLHNAVYVVIAVDNETLKSTLRPAAFAEINDETVDRILSYGSNLYMLYYSPVTIVDESGTEVQCNRLSIDDKFTLFGNHSSNYQLIRTLPDGTKQVISQTTVDAITVVNAGATLANGLFKRVDSNAEGTDRVWTRSGKTVKIKHNSSTNKWELVNIATNVVYYTASIDDENKEPWELQWTATDPRYGTVPNLSHVISPNGVYGGVAETVIGSGIRKCISCYSFADFEDGEAITINIYDAAGILLASSTLITKRALVLHDLSDESNPIVKFEITANQMIDGTLFLYRNQDPDELAIYPKITYANGEQEIVSVGDGNGYCYGKDEINTKFVGVEYPITVKYYIPIETQTTIAEGIDDRRFLVATANVKIVDATENTLSKISVIPTYNSGDDVYDLQVNGYLINRSGRVLLTNKATITGFHGTPDYFGRRQDVNISVEQVREGGSVENFNQTVYIEVKAPYTYVNTIINESHIGKSILVGEELTEITTVNLELYLGNTYPIYTIQNPFLIDSTSDENSIPYGSETEPHIAPFIKYDSVTKKYSIPGDVFCARTNLPGNDYSQSAVDVFLENFYYTAKPPYGITESSAADNPPTHFTIRVPNIDKPILSLQRKVEDFAEPFTFDGYPEDAMVGNTVVVEFWRETASGVYEILFGVPVYVR